MVQIIVLIIVGLAGGILGGMGMGGGTLLIPLLILFCGMEQHGAQAVNLVAFVPMAVIALILHFKNQLIDFKDVLWLMIPAVAVSVFASIFVKRIENELLGKLFGGFLIILGIYQLVSAILYIVKKHKEKKRKEQELAQAPQSAD